MQTNDTVNICISQNEIKLLGAEKRETDQLSGVFAEQIGCHDDFLIFFVYFSLVNDMNGQKFFTTVEISIFMRT